MGENVEATVNVHAVEIKWVTNQKYTKQKCWQTIGILGISKESLP
jgi:hypothetical protein